MEILLHVCCGPCTLYPLRVLRERGIEVTGFFFNPNIHPFREFERRVEALETVSEMYNFRVIWSREGYGLRKYLAAIGSNMEPADRCPACYELRLEETARKAAELSMPAFSTTLLYSRYQRHGLIREMGQEIARKHGLEFFYEDFREGWIQGIEEAVAIGIYRQPYCGCIFSEAERYSKRMARLVKRLEAQEERP